jgi:hypothetical protein
MVEDIVGQISEIYDRFCELAKEQGYQIEETVLFGSEPEMQGRLKGTYISGKEGVDNFFDNLRKADEDLAALARSALEGAPENYKYGLQLVQHSSSLRESMFTALRDGVAVSGVSGPPKIKARVYFTHEA